VNENGTTKKIGGVLSEMVGAHCILCQRPFRDMTIDTPAGRIFITGDLKFDNPATDYWRRFFICAR